MSYESFEKYQYDSCLSRGICSINPQNSALQTVIVLYLRIFAKFAINLDLDKEIKDFILNTISITIYNPEFNENSFIFAVENFKNILPEIMKQFLDKKPQEDMQEEENKAYELFKETEDIISAIKYGEKIFIRAQENISQEIRDIYSIMLVITKSLSINLLDLESFEKFNNESFLMILKLLTQIDLGEKNLDKLKVQIFEASKMDVELMKNIREVQEEFYGKQSEASVSYSTVPNKAILVVGSNIRELEIILEALKNENIDVYTHDEMMIAHTFPKFSEYPRLKGQFGQGMESCLLDFSTFPGPIILTKHSLHNIENLYRGRLFTTDYMTNPKGIIKIENNNFSKVIESAELAKGFKHGRQCESVTIGYNYYETISLIKKKFNEKKYERIFIIGLAGYSFEQNSYFEKLIKLVPDNVLIVSFSYNSEKENLLHLNSCFDNYAWVRIFENIKSLAIPISIFVPKCERSTISQILYFVSHENVSVYIGKCTPIILNPSLINTLKSIFLVEETTSSKKDLERIIADK